ncbi:MAG: type II secretion system F family protein [Bacteriovoracaceae bacterium]|nr:type II secretion system F family protein [Bacteriovoracaceae bacterium]
MPIYKYRGMNAVGKQIKGDISADGLQQAKQKLRGQGIMLTSLEEATSKTTAASGVSFGSPIKVEDLAIMTRQLATLLKARIQVVQALEALIEQSTNPRMKVILAEICQKVNEGSSLAKALADYPKVFNHIYVNMVEAGESSGTLDIVLLRLAEFTENQVRLRTRIQGALMYPILMCIFGGIMMGVIFMFVMPKISSIFVSMKKELPIQTKFCMWLSHFMLHYWYLVIIGAVAIVFLVKTYLHTKRGKANWDKVALKIPVLKDLIIMMNVQRFCATLETLLQSSVPILVALNIVRNLIGNVHMQAAVEEAKLSVGEGGSMTGPLKKSGYYPPMVTNMIGLGERSGEIGPMLKIIAENYENQVNAKLSGLTSILEPIMLVGMGAGVAFVVFAVLMPLMQMNSMH